MIENKIRKIKPEIDPLSHKKLHERIREMSKPKNNIIFHKKTLALSTLAAFICTIFVFSSIIKQTNPTTQTSLNSVGSSPETSNKIFKSSTPEPSASDSSQNSGLSKEKESSVAIMPPVKPSVPSSSKNRKISYNTTLNIAVDSISRKSQQVFTIVDSSQGLILNSSVQDGNQVSPYATFDISVPSEKLGLIVSRLGKLGQIKQRMQTSNDITGIYDEQAEQVKELKAERTSLLKELKQSKNIKTREKIKQALKENKTNLKNMLMQFNSTDRSVKMSSVQLTLEKSAKNVSSNNNDSVFQKSLNKAWNVLLSVLGFMIIMLAFFTPIFGFLFCLVWLNSKIRKK